MCIVHENNFYQKNFGLKVSVVFISVLTEADCTSWQGLPEAIKTKHTGNYKIGKHLHTLCCCEPLEINFIQSFIQSFIQKKLQKIILNLYYHYVMSKQMELI